MKNMTRVVSFVLVMAMCLTFASFAVETRASLYISQIATSITSENGITVGFVVVGTGKMTDIGATRIEIKNASGMVVATYRYTDDGYSHLMGHNTVSYSSSVTYEDAIPGNEYYAVIYYKAGNSSGSDSDSYTTGLRTA